MVTQYRYQTRRDTAAHWLDADPVLLPGEVALSTDTHEVRYGNGVDVWSDLPAHSSNADLILATAKGAFGGLATLNPAGAEEGKLLEAQVPTRLTAATLSDTYSPVLDAGSRLKAKLDLQQAATIFVASDSTADASDEWVHKWIESMATSRPELRTAYYVWNGSTAMSAAEVINAGGPQPRATISDTFTRSAAEIVGTSPDVGLPWVGQTSSWTVNGTDAVRASATAVGEVATKGGLFGDMAATFSNVVISTVADASFRWCRFIIKYVDTNNYLFLNVGISTGGGRLWSIEKRIAGTITVVTQGANNPASLPAATATLTIPTITVSLTGTTLSAAIGSDTLTGSITAGDATALELGDGIGMRFDNQNGAKIASIGATVTPTANPTRTLAVYNGAMAGSDLSYQTSRLATMCPVTPDVIFISSSHNYAVAGSAYVVAVQAFVDACHVLWPSAGVVVMSQNPRKLPASAGGNQVHLERLATLKSYARAKRWGYIPVMEAFLARPDSGYALVNSDGIHPSAAGSLLWRDTVVSWLATL